MALYACMHACVRACVRACVSGSVIVRPLLLACDGQRPFDDHLSKTLKVKQVCTSIKSMDEHVLSLQVCRQNERVMETE